MEKSDKKWWQKWSKLDRVIPLGTICEPTVHRRLFKC
jgi:hypothetical protein